MFLIVIQQYLLSLNRASLKAGMFGQKNNASRYVHTSSRPLQQPSGTTGTINERVMAAEVNIN